jgi:hypothetical protein
VDLIGSRSVDTISNEQFSNYCELAHQTLEAHGTRHIFRYRGRFFGFLACKLLTGLEARVGIEPTHKGFADLSLTAWVPRHS